ncbi:von Willebrand factor A domain-containing protein 5A [Tritrichomonas musculus]|uniref:von Willebrand factor A domain-containing protein 5A n=1 Tax=Tritrichomonas musculus TaxID=1915356 RepID=A0ABR2KXF8_9EUKA
MPFGNLILSQATFSHYHSPTRKDPQLIKTLITGSILHSFASLTYCELFTTLTDDFYEIFINPPEGCVIYNIKGKYSDKTTEFVVHKLKEPISNGYYGLYSNSDAINLTLGYIQSNASVTIEITCTFTAVLESNSSFKFSFPADSKLLNTQFSTDIILSNSFEDSTKIKSSEGIITYKDNHLIMQPFNLEKKFELTFEFNSPIKSSSFKSKIDQYNYTCLSLLPKSKESNFVLKQEIYLLIDCSGSMHGSKISNAQIALENFLKSLPKNCYFNILRFGTSFEQMFEHSVENNEENISKSIQYASMLKADLGCTDIYSPLMSIISENPKKGFVRQVFALTDGEVDNPANVIAICTANRHIMRVFPFGIGCDVNHAFLMELAKATTGEAHFINNMSIDSISDTVLATLKSSQVAAVVNTQVYLEGIDSFEVAPQPIPSLFANFLTNVIIRYKDDNNANKGEFVLVTGEYGNTSYEETIKIAESDVSIDFHKLFAYQNIRDMEDRLVNLDKPEESELIREKVVRLSIQSHIISSFTGMFTVINGVEQNPDDLQKEMEKYQEEQFKLQRQGPIRQQQFPKQQQIQTQQQFPMQQIQMQQQYPIHQIQMQQQSPIKQMQIQQQSPIQQMQMKQRFPIQQQIPIQQMQMPMQQLCQQRMTQKQSRNQQAFAQRSLPVQKVKRNWGSLQNRPQSATKVFAQAQQKRPNQDQVQKQQKPPNQRQQTRSQIQKDEFVLNLLAKQQSDGSWNDLSLIGQLVNVSSSTPTISDLFSDFPSVKQEMEGLSDTCIITLLVVCWMLSERKETLPSFEREARRGIDYVRSNSNKNVSSDFSSNLHFTNGISWR